MKFVIVAAIAAAAFFCNPLAVEAQVAGLNLTGALDLNATLQSVVTTLDGVISSVESTIPVVASLLPVILVSYQKLLTN
jgi:hypothetical protein